MLGDIYQTLELIHSLKPRLVIHFQGKEFEISPEDVELLRKIMEEGSIRKASIGVGIDYKTYWSRIRRLELMLGLQLIRKQRGGTGGGRVQLTLAGQALLERYRVTRTKLDRYITQLNLEPDLKIYGSDCPGVELLVSTLSERNVFAEYLKVGSEPGFQLLLQGYTHIVGVHLIDPDTGEYNFHLLRRAKEKRLALIKGYWREIGFIVARGNPKNIFTPEDLLRKDVVLANRNKGSGSYALLRYLLGKMSRQYSMPLNTLTRRIKGYDTEYLSHFEAASAVLHGKADVTVGPKWTATSLGLEFIPIAKEKFDFITLAEHLQRDQLGDFIEVLRSKEFAQKASSLGISTDSETGTILRT